DWILTPSRSRPVMPLEGVKTSTKLMEQARMPGPAKTAVTASSHGNGAHVGPALSNGHPKQAVQAVIVPPSRLDTGHVRQPDSVNAASTPRIDPAPAPVPMPKPKVVAHSTGATTKPSNGANVHPSPGTPSHSQPVSVSSFSAEIASMTQPSHSASSHSVADVPSALIHAAADPQAITGRIHRWFDVRESEHRLLERLLDLQAAAGIGMPVRKPAAIAPSSNGNGNGHAHSHGNGAATMPVAPQVTEAAPAAASGTRWAEMPRVATRSVKPTGARATVARVSAPAMAPAPQPMTVPVPQPAPAAPKAQIVEHRAPAAEPMAAPAPSANCEAPSVEDFRKELLRVTSLRTGYPVETLDETLPLESGLGIDSIK